MQTEYKGTPIQIPIAKGLAKSTNHKGNVIDVLRQIYNKPVSLDDIGINAARNTKIHSTITVMSPNISEKDERRKKLEEQVAELRESECMSDHLYGQRAQECGIESAKGNDTLWTSDSSDRYLFRKFYLDLGRNRLTRRKSCAPWSSYAQPQV